jgi:hypothetical protein
LHVLELGQKQPSEFGVPMNGILGSQPVEVFMWPLAKDRVERGKLNAGGQGLLV